MKGLDEYLLAIEGQARFLQAIYEALLELDPSYFINRHAVYKGFYGADGGIAFLPVKYHDDDTSEIYDLLHLSDINFDQVTPEPDLFQKLKSQLKNSALDEINQRKNNPQHAAWVAEMEELIKAIEPIEADKDSLKIFSRFDESLKKYIEENKQAALLLKNKIVDQDAFKNENPQLVCVLSGEIAWLPVLLTGKLVDYHELMKFLRKFPCTNPVNDSELRDHQIKPAPVHFKLLETLVNSKAPTPPQSTFKI